MPLKESLVIVDSSCFSGRRSLYHIYLVIALLKCNWFSGEPNSLLSLAHARIVIGARCRHSRNKNHLCDRYKVVALCTATCTKFFTFPGAAQFVAHFGFRPRVFTTTDIRGAVQSPIVRPYTPLMIHECAPTKTNSMPMACLVPQMAHTYCPVRN